MMIYNVDVSPFCVIGTINILQQEPTDIANDEKSFVMRIDTADRDVCP